MSTQAIASAEILIEGLACVCCAEAIERAVRATPGVAGAHLDYGADLLRIAYDPLRVGEDELRAPVRDSGYRCSGDGARPSAAELGHAAQLAPITCGTRSDGMQYELPHTAAMHDHAVPVTDPDHAGLSHDMADPTMAADMERDMRRRLFVALALTIPLLVRRPVLRRGWRRAAHAIRVLHKHPPQPAEGPPERAAPLLTSGQAPGLALAPHASCVRVATARGVALGEDQRVLAQRGQELVAERAAVGRGLEALRPAHRPPSRFRAEHRAPRRRTRGPGAIQLDPAPRPPRDRAASTARPFAWDGDAGEA